MFIDIGITCQIRSYIEADTAKYFVSCVIKNAYYITQQARRKVLKTGGVRYTKGIEESEFLGKFLGVSPKNRGCTCTPGTPPSAGPEMYLYYFLNQNSNKKYKFTVAIIKKN